MLAYSPPVVPRSSVVNYAGPQVLDQSERKKIGPKHFVMLTVSSEELARVRNERRRVELNRPSFLLAQLPQIGSRGDIQPCEKAHRSPVNSRCLWTDRFSLSPRADIALSIGLMKDGHRCTIVTHDEFKPWIECEPPPFFHSKPVSRFADPCSSSSMPAFGIQHRQTGGDPEALSSSFSLELTFLHLSISS